MPDSANHCPKCGKAAAVTQPAPSANPFTQQNNAVPPQNTPYTPQNAPYAPQGYPQNYGAPNGGADFRSTMNNYNSGLPSIRIGSRTIQLSIGLLLVPVMIILLIIGMVGINSFETVKLKVKRADYTMKYSLSDIEFDVDDLPLTIFVKIIAIVCIIATVAVLLLAVFKTVKAEIEKAVKLVGTGGIIMAFGYLATVINGYYMRGEFNSEFVKCKGGASITAWIWLLIMVSVAAGARLIAASEEQKNALKAAEGERNSRFGGTF